MRTAFPGVAYVSSTLAALSIVGCQSSDPGIRGAWSAEEYVLASGPVHPVTGRIFFTETDWTVLYFAQDGSGVPRRGSAEGGTYSLTGEQLVFTHLFNLSVGDSLAGLPQSPLRMDAHTVEEAAEEPTTARIEEDRLTLFFPSGNQMSFSRSSHPDA